MSKEQRNNLSSGLPEPELSLYNPELLQRLAKLTEHETQVLSVLKPDEINSYIASLHAKIEVLEGLMLSAFDTIYTMQSMLLMSGAAIDNLIAKRPAQPLNFPSLADASQKLSDGQ